MPGGGDADGTHGVDGLAGAGEQAAGERGADKTRVFGGGGRLGRADEAVALDWNCLTEEVHECVAGGGGESGSWRRGGAPQ